MARVRRRVRVKNEKSKYRFSKNKVYTSELTGLNYHYQGKNAGGVFQFLTTGNGGTLMWSGYERELDKLELKES